MSLGLCPELERCQRCSERFHCDAALGAQGVESTRARGPGSPGTCGEGRCAGILRCSACGWGFAPAAPQ